VPVLGRRNAGLANDAGKHWGQDVSFGQIGLTDSALCCLIGPRAPPLRIERPGGRYHVTARGNDRKAIFRDDTDHFHFLELLSELGERFGAGVHAYALMDKHYHLMLQTPEANLSRSMHRLKAD